MKNKSSIIESQTQFVDTTIAFKYNWKCWRFLGMHPFKRYKALYIFYSIIINIGISIMYPSTLVVQVFFSENLKQMLERLTLTSSNVACGLKQLNAFIRRSKLISITDYINQLDARARHPDEQNILKSTIKTLHKFFFVYFWVYVFTGLLSEIATLIAKPRRLMYPAWFPFDWQESNVKYYAANMYQFFGLYVGITQELTNDSFPAIYIGVLKGHVQALMERIKRIGSDARKSLEDNYDELVGCVRDYRILIQYYEALQTILTFALLLQFFVTGLVCCLTAVYVFFVDGSTFDMVYLGCYFVCVVLEVLISCYYGNELIYESHLITTAIYSCNWTDQSPRFKKVMIIFMQSTQKDMQIMAGGLINVNLETFMSIMKSSYSLFAVLLEVA